MTYLNKIWSIGLLAFLLITLAPAKSHAQGGEFSTQDFYDQLAPYGTWVTDPQYGDVWIPDAEDNFMPYGTQGHWVLTEYGNTWVSDYPWGWATFHYGRWHYDDYYGWEWVPGDEWAPAWVSWRQGGGYYGWAPLTPGISLSVSFGGGYNVPDNYWVCAPQAYINRPNIYNYYVPHTRVINIIHRTTIINNIYTRDNRRYIAGPRVEDIQRYTHQRPQVYKINNAGKPGAINVSNNVVNIYRPAVRKAPDARPARVVDGAAYRQQNPNQGIAHRGPGGAAAINHENASKLADVARTTTPDNKIVRVNNRPNMPNPAPQGNRPNAPGQPDNRVGNDHNRPGQPNAPQPNATPGQPGNRPTNEQHNRPGQPAVAPNAPQPNTTPGQPDNNNRGDRGNHGGRPENRPNLTPANPANPNPAAQPNVQPNRPAQPAVVPNAQQPNPAPGQPNNRGDRGNRGGQPDNRPNVTPQNPATQPDNNDAQQQQNAQREQQRTQRQQQMQQQNAQRQQQAQQQQAQQQQAQQRQQQDAQRQQQQAQQQQMQQQRQQQAQQQAQQQQAQQRQQAQAQQQAQQQQAQRQQQSQQQQVQQQQRQQQQQRMQQQQQRQQQHQQQPRPAPKPEEHKP